MSSGRFRPTEALLAAFRRLDESAVLRLALAFAAPLALGAALFVAATYILVVTEDAKVTKEAADFEVRNFLSENPEKKIDLVGGWITDRLTTRATTLGPVDTYYFLAEGHGDKTTPLVGEKDYANPQPVDCRLWLSWGPCAPEQKPVAGVTWSEIMVGKPPIAVGLAATIDVTSYWPTRIVDGKPVPKPPTFMYIGHLSSMAAFEARMLSLAVWTLGLAALGAMGVGYLVGRNILRRVDALNAVLDRVREGEFAARAADTARDEFGALGRNVNLMLERINHLVLHAQDVSDRIAHDLRRPIANLRARLERIARARSLDEARTAAEDAVDETDSVLASFQSLLHIGELYAGADKGLQRIDLADSVRKAVELYEVVAEEAGVTLRLAAEPAPMLGNEGQLMLLINNLVDNAIKYSPRGGEVRVRIGRSDGAVVLRVTDQGPGIPLDEREAVFKPFVRGAAAAASGSTSGYGHGLAEVDAVVKRHAARRRVEDAHPTGADITIEFRAYE